MKKPLANFQIDFISKLFKDTNSFKRVEIIGEAFNNLKKEKNYTFSSIRKLCFDVKAFIRWLNSGHQKSYRVNKSAIEDAISCWLRETAKESLKEQKERKEKRFADVPTMEMLCEVQDRVENLIESRCEIDSPWHPLTITEKLSLLLFQIHSRANCRVGVLLNFSTKDLENYQPGDYIRSNDHKTGSIFTNFAYITNSEKQLLQSLHQEYEEKFRTKPSVIFPGNYDKDLTTQATHIAKLMKNLFNITSFKFHPNACRKVWDTFYFKNKEQIPEKLQRLFESNTGHSDKTRQLHYTLPPTNEDLHGLFEATGKIREDFRKKRAESSTSTQLTDSVLPVQNSPTSVTEFEDSTVVNEDMQPSTSATKSPKKSDEEKKRKIEAKKARDQSESLSNESERDEILTGSASDSNFQPPSKFKVMKIEKSSGVTRSESDKIWDAIQIKMLKQPQSDFYLKNQFRRACQRVAGARTKLSKQNIRDLVRELKLPAEDEEKIFKKLYTKTMNVYAAVRL